MSAVSLSVSISHKTKGCRKVVKNVVNRDNFVVVNLKVVKVVSFDNEKVVNLTTQILHHVVRCSVVIVTIFVDNLSSGDYQNRHRPRDNSENPKVTLTMRGQLYDNLAFCVMSLVVFMSLCPFHLSGHARILDHFCLYLPMNECNRTTVRQGNFANFEKVEVIRPASCTRQNIPLLKLRRGNKNLFDKNCPEFFHNPQE